MGANNSSSNSSRWKENSTRTQNPNQQHTILTLHITYWRAHVNIFRSLMQTNDSLTRTYIRDANVDAEKHSLIVCACLVLCYRDTRHKTQFMYSSNDNQKKIYISNSPIRDMPNWNDIVSISYRECACLHHSYLGFCFVFVVSAKFE